VNPAIETREAIGVAIDGIWLRGTYHKPGGAGSTSVTDAGKNACPGLLFLNHGFLPRAAPGDSAAYWGDLFAERGYPSFRFDLPGLGDSGGEPPAQMLEMVNRGDYAPVVSAIVKELVARYHLPGMVIVGHCAGSVTALFTAPVTKEVKGLVLTDPYFFLPRDRTKIRVELSQWSSWSRFGALVSAIYYLTKHMRLLLGRNRPPRNANLPLLRCWNQAASAGLPLLVLKAPALKSRGLKPRMGEFDYLGYLQSMSGGSRVCVQFIEGTNHSFADAKGRAAVRQNIAAWLDNYFPAPHRNRASEQTSSLAEERAYESAVPQ
jgi:pimeloyl-ACP methyl ester carboxylesterase